MQDWRDLELNIKPEVRKYSNMEKFLLNRCFQIHVNFLHIMSTDIMHQNRIPGFSCCLCFTNTHTHIQLYRPYVLSILSIMEILQPHFVCRSPRNCFQLAFVSFSLKCRHIQNHTCTNTHTQTCYHVSISML